MRRTARWATGADPFIDAQDFEIAAFAIDVKEPAPGKAVGTVRFKNFNEDQTITLDLVKLQGRLAHRRDPRPGNRSLRALFKKR